MSLATLESRLDHRFGDPALLEQALTHRSHGARHNERLEFLGDSVLNFVVAALLFERYAKGGDNPKLKDWAGKTLPHLQHHLEMAQALNKNRK